ncbi:MAG: hypothetical protein ACTSSA_05620, partial [Candidatus Freyarchaeota archaeon]
IIKLRNRVSIDIFVTERVGVPLILLKGIAYPNTNFQILLIVRGGWLFSSYWMLKSVSSAAHHVIRWFLGSK